MALALKWIDVIGQLLMLFPLVFPDCFAGPLVLESLGSNSVLQTYFAVGAWQLLSLVLHALADPESRARRTAYARVLGILVLVAVLALICIAVAVGKHPAFQIIGQFGGGLLIALMAVLLLAAPVLAVWYFCICAGELRQHHAAVSHRREIHWKL